MPLLGVQPSTASHAARGVGSRRRRASEPSSGICLAALAGLPPSPLFVSELLVALGGIRPATPRGGDRALMLLALGFLGLCHALIEAVAGGGEPPARSPPGRRLVMGLAAGCLVLLPALAGAALALPGSAIADALVRGLS